MSNPDTDLTTKKVTTIPDAFREKLAGKTGKLYWKSFEELADTDAFKLWMEDEFPNRATLFNVDRRQFLTLGGAALAMAGLSGCRILPSTKAVPYVRAPEEMIPGLPLVYATAFSRGGYGIGTLVESHEGRPTKIEGNPQHPASLGATDAFTQAEILSMYDPDRSQATYFNGEMSSWDQFIGALRKAMSERAVEGGKGMVLLTENITSPTLLTQITALLKKFPQARWQVYEPLARDAVFAGTQAAFGQPLNPVYNLKNARVILSLDADFLLTMPGSVRYAADFAAGRRVRKSNPTMNRLYTVEASYTITGAMADHRFPVKPSQVEAIAQAIYAGLTGTASEVQGISASALQALVKDLKANPGAAVVVPGEDQSAAVHAYAQAINAALGAVGKTVTYTQPVEGATAGTRGAQTAGLKTLVDDINAGGVKMLVLLGGNPVYNAPADIKLGAALGASTTGATKVPLVVRLGMYNDETSYLSHWHIPESHPLEAWSDVRAHDGTVSVVQPLIAPLYETRSAHELLAEMLGEPQAGFDIVQNYWRDQLATAGDFNRAWEQTLHNGIVANSALPAVAVTLAPGFAPPATAGVTGSGLEVAFRPDPTLWDGRYANNSWLQELPKPITTITWDNAAIISPKTAKENNLIPNESDNDAKNIGQVTGKRVVEVTVSGTKLALPIWVLPGQPDGVITLHLGFGRTRAGNVGNQQGFDTYALRTSQTMGWASGAKVALTGDTYEISTTQAHHEMRGINEEHNREIVKAGTLAEFIAGHGEAVAIAKPEALPAVTAFPHAGEAEAETNNTNADGSGGQDPSYSGSRQNETEEVTADYYRKTWKYTNKAGSNKSGYPSLYPEFSNKDYNAWAMSIDLTTCIGCNACTIACQAENNIPTVGKEQVGKGREMHWIRIDHYYSSESLEDVESYFQPVACVHCEKAPCEPVCPVAATIHNHEGLNQMVYNRCIGTRYCSNNCPYKVRRFNFLKWTAGKGGVSTVNYDLPVLKMAANPDVTVRGRGVMEKCTYCIQRINAKRIEAKKEQREIQDGEVITACQQVCPTRAIVFGDINNPNSEVSKLRLEPHDYSLLEELNTRPRTTYMARIKNPNPELAAAAKA